MRYCFALLALLPLSVIEASDPPLVEQYLRTGKLEEGLLSLESKLKQTPKDDELRFGLGLLQITHGVERLGQSFYRYGLRTSNSWTPFVRLPIPLNPNPSPINARKFRAILDEFQNDLVQAEATLAGITDDAVKLRIRLAIIKVDFDGDGKPTDMLVDVIDKLMGGRPEFLKTNEDFRVHFDRGDVAWFRAYCHLICSLIDIFQSIQTDADFYFFAQDFFPKVQPELNSDEAAALRKSTLGQSGKIPLFEPKRLSSFRKHLIMVCKLNYETWKFIKAETDDDYEWLPNPKQKGIFGVPVNDQMIAAWLSMMEELESLLEGKKIIPLDFLPNSNGKGFNLKAFLEDAPNVIDINEVSANGIANKYMSNGDKIDLNVFFRTMQVFNNPLRMGFFAWFN
jgi:hypothetical protein